MGYLQVQQKGTAQEGVEFVPLPWLTAVWLQFHAVARAYPRSSLIVQPCDQRLPSLARGNRSAGVVEY